MTETETRLQGKRAFVTGAGSGIGQAVAVRLAAEGAKVGLVGRRTMALEETAARIEAAGGTCLAVSCDVSKEVEVELAVARIEEAFGGLDTVVGVAGIELIANGDARIDQLELASWQQTIDVNLTGMFLTCKYGTRALLRNGGGSIVITGIAVRALRPLRRGARLQREQGWCSWPRARDGERPSDRGNPRQLCHPRLHRYSRERPNLCGSAASGRGGSKHPPEAPGSAR